MNGDIDHVEHEMADDADAALVEDQVVVFFLCPHGFGTDEIVEIYGTKDKEESTLNDRPLVEEDEDECREDTAMHEEDTKEGS